MQTVNTDPVNRPVHYTRGGIECIDAIRASMTPEEFNGFLKGNAIKYQWRYRHKGNPVQDLSKAAWYLQRLADSIKTTVPDAPAPETLQPVVPPVQVGQTVYVLRRPLHFKAHFTTEKVERIVVEYTTNGALCKFSSRSFEAYAEDIGKDVFLNKEAAAAALRKEGVDLE